MRGCPYCSYESDPKSAATHIKRIHPDKPHASDEDWPGWREPKDGGEWSPTSYQ